MLARPRPNSCINHHVIIRGLGNLYYRQLLVLVLILPKFVVVGVDGFSADRWKKLSDAERIEHCRMAAREADAYAELARPELQTVYKDLAAQWHMLASEIERVMIQRLAAQ